MNNKFSGCGSIFAVLLTVVFITLKLADVIDWSWLWVLSPIWIVVGLVVLLLRVALAVQAAEEEEEEDQPF